LVNPLSDSEVLSDKNSLRQQQIVYKTEQAVKKNRPQNMAMPCSIDANRFE
jgi:hypothetical protein